MKKDNEKTEYNEDFEFFLEHQVAVSYTNGKRWATIFSLLDGDVFATIKQSCEIPDTLIMQVIKENHERLTSKTKAA